MLLLSSIKIENFRGIRQGSVEGLTEVNVLIGRNNCGKTTLAEAIQKTLVGSGQEDLLGRQISAYWMGVRNENLGTKGKFPNATGQARYRGKTQYSDRILEAVALYERPLRSDSDQLQLMEIELSASTGTDGGPRNRFLGSVKQSAKQTVCFRPSEASNSQIEAKLWQQLLAIRSDKRLATALNDVFGLKAETFQLLPNGQLLVLFENHSVPLDAQGDGTRAAMRALMLLTALKQTLFIMEEPECHQHPGSLEKFARAVCNLAKLNEVQLIVSTHSAECVSAFLKASEGAKSSAAVFHLSLNDGIQTARRLDPDAVQTLTETGVDVRFLDLYS